MFQPVPSWKKRNRAAQALRESEAQWREVFEHNPVMYFMVGPTGIVLSVNGFGAAQLGYTVAELVGQSVLHVFFEEDHQAVKDQLATCVQNPGRSHSWEIRKIRKDGSVLWVRENAKAVQRPGNDVIILIACEDITERRRGERRVAAAYAVTRILAEADSLAAVGPDLLRAIGGNLEWDSFASHIRSRRASKDAPLAAPRGHAASKQKRRSQLILKYNRNQSLRSSIFPLSGRNRPECNIGGQRG